MKKYIVKRKSDLKILSEWTSDFANKDYYEENWGSKYQEIVHPAITKVIKQGSPAEYEIKITPEIPAVFDKNTGEEVSPRVPEFRESILIKEAIPNELEVIKEAWTEIFEADYIVEEKDITAEVEAKAAKKAEADSRLDQLSKIDWAKTDTIAELKVIVKLLVDELINNQKGHGYPGLKDWLKVLGVIVTAPISIPVLIIREKIKNKDKK